MPAGADAYNRAVGSSVLLRNLHPNFENIELYWTSCLFIRGELYLDHQTNRVIVSLGFRDKHSWGFKAAQVGESSSECWSLRSNTSLSKEHLCEMFALGFARPHEITANPNVERYTAIPTSPCV
jgi:hypothetical protein